MSQIIGMSFVSSSYEVDEADIMGLPIADGLKEALLNRGFSRNQIFEYTADELASILEIDQYVANLILEAAKQ
jgi:hypothetical protein